MPPHQLTGVTPHQENYANMLRAAYRWFWHINDPDYALEQDEATWQKIWRDSKVAQAMHQRKASVAGKTWTVQPGSESPAVNDIKAAEVAKAGLKMINNFSQSRMTLVDAIFRGRSFAFVEGFRRSVSLAGTDAQEWWVPRNLKHVDKQRLRIVPVVEGEPGKRKRVRTKVEMADEVEYVWREVPLDRYRQFVRILYADEESTLGYGRGMLTSIYFTWWLKQEVLQEGLSGLERWARGAVAVKTDLQAQTGKEGKDTETIREEFLTVLENMMARHSLAFDKNDEVVELGAQARGGGQLVIDFVRYLDDSLIGLILGSILPFGGAGDKGSLARAEVEMDTTDILLNMDRELLGEALTQGVISNFWRFNRPQLAAVGLGGAAMPRFSVTAQRHEDPEVNARIMATLLPRGIPILKSQVYEKTGLTMPGPDDEVFELPGVNGGAPSDGGGFPDLSSSLGFRGFRNN